MVDFYEKPISIRDSEAMRELARRLSKVKDDGQTETTTVSSAEVKEMECPDSEDD